MITIRQEPFPHLIVEGVYTQQELSDVWKLIEDKKDFMPANLIGSTTGNHLAVFLDTTDIKPIGDEVTKAFKEISPYHRAIDSCETKYIKLNYYQNFNHYPAHTDIARYTAVTFLNKEPKKFEGGDLKFTEFDYVIPFENNKMVLFCGCFFHEVTPVTLNETDYLTGNGRYAITQFLDAKEHNANIPKLSN